MGDYRTNVYSALKGELGDSFTKTPEEFNAALDADTAYSTKVYQALKGEMGNSFSKTQDEFKSLISGSSAPKSTVEDNPTIDKVPLDNNGEPMTPMQEELRKKFPENYENKDASNKQEDLPQQIASANDLAKFATTEAYKTMLNSTKIGIEPEGTDPNTELTLDGKDKTLLDRAKYQYKNLQNSVVGGITQFLTQVEHPAYSLGLMTANAVDPEAPPVPTGMEPWAEKRKENAIWLKNYNPNSVEDIAAFGVGVLVDLPVFGEFGKLGSAAWKVVPGAIKTARNIDMSVKILAGAGEAMSKKLLLSGVKKEAADWAVKNAIMNIGNQTGQAALASATALGGHTATLDIITQLGEGKSIEDINLEQTAKRGGNSAILGAFVGPLGLTSSQAGKYAASFTEKPLLKSFIEKGVKLAGFEAEVAAFTVGGKYLEGDKTPTTVGDIVKANLMFGMLHGYGVGDLNKAPLSGRPELAYDRYKNFEKTNATKDELDAAGYETPALLWDAVENNKINLTDKNIPATLKAKILYAVDPKNIDSRNLITGFDLTNQAQSAEAKTENGISRIKTYDKDGNLLEVVTSEDPQVVSDHMQYVLDQIRIKNAKNFASSSHEATYEVTTALNKKGLSRNWPASMSKHPLDITTEEANEVDSYIKIIEGAKKKIVKGQKDRLDKEQKAKEAEVEKQKKDAIDAIEKKREEDLAAAQPKTEATPEQKKKDDINDKADEEIKKVEEELAPPPPDKVIDENGQMVDYKPKEETIEAQKQEIISYSENKENIPSLADKISKGETLTNEDLQLQKNFPTETEAALNQIKLITKTTEDGKNNAERQGGQGNQEGLLTPEKDVTVQEPQTTEAPIKPTIESKANALADAIQNKRFYTSVDDIMKLKGDVMPVEIVKAFWDGSLNTAAGVIRAGGKVAQAVSDAIVYLKDTDWYKGLTDESKKIAERKLRDDIKNNIQEANDIRKLAQARIRQEKLDAKKTRSKLPSENPVKKVELSESAGLKDQLKLEVRSALASFKETKKGFQGAAKAAKNILKQFSSANKGVLTAGQYRSIINRLGNAFDSDKRQAVYDYIDKVIDGAEYKKEVKDARTYIDKIRIHNGSKKEGFGNAKYLVEQILQINPKNLTTEELSELNGILSKVLKGKTPDAGAIIEAYYKASEYNSDVLKIKDAPTFGKLYDKIESISQEIGKIEDMAGYTKMTSVLNSAVNRLKELSDLGIITEEEYKSAWELIGGKDVYDKKSKKFISHDNGLDADVIENSGKFEKELAEFKKAYVDQIMNTKKSLKIGKFDKFKDETREQIFKLLNFKRQDIEELDGIDIDAYNQFLKNIPEGALMPSSVELITKLDTKAIQRKYLTEAFKIYAKSKKGQEFLNGNPTMNKLMDTKEGMTDQQIFEYVRSLNPRELETILGNLGTSDGLSRTLTDVGVAVIAYNKQKKLGEENLIKIRSRLLKDFPNVGGRSKLRNSARGLAGRTKYTSQKNELNYMGMILSESSFRSSITDPKNEASILDFMFGENYKTNKDNCPDPVEFADKKRTYERLMFDAKKAGAVRNLNGREVLDIDKFINHIKSDTQSGSRWNYIQDMRGFYKSMEGMAEAATLINGRTYVGLGENYVPMKEYKKSRFVDSEDLISELNLGWSKPKMTSGSTFQRQNKLFMIETNADVVAHTYLNQVSRNYHVLPKLRSNTNAIKEASLKSGGENMVRLGRAYQRGLVSRTAFVLNGRKKEIYNDMSKLFDRLFAAKKKALIANPNRVPAEYLSNTIRGTISTLRSGGGNFEYSNHPEVYQSIMDTYFGDKHFSRWDQDANENILTSKIGMSLEKGALGLITYSDTQIGRGIFSRLFAKEFQDKTGDKFDATKYEDSTVDSEGNTYKEKFADEIEHAASWGLRRTEELFNSKNIMSQPEMTRFGILGAWDPNNFLVKTVDGLQGFNRNEWSQMKIAYRRAANGTGAEKAMGWRDLFSIPISNFTYMQARLGTNVAVKYGIQSAVIGNIDDSTKKQIHELATWTGWGENLVASFVQLGMGGSTGVYRAGFNAVKLGMISSKVESKVMDDIFLKASDQLMIPTVNNYGNVKSFLGALAPGPTTSMINDIYALGGMFDAAHNAFDRGYINKEQLLQIANGVNITLMYGWSNPASGWLQSQLSPAINAEKGGSSGVGSSSGRPSLARPSARPERPRSPERSRIERPRNN